jgi:membrane-associated HD superfamily phosphohydrolase
LDIDLLKNKYLFIVVLSVLALIVFYFYKDNVLVQTPKLDTNITINKNITKQKTTTKNHTTKTTDKSSKQNIELPPNFPKPLPPLDNKELKAMDNLIIKGDDIIENMDKILQEIELPPLNKKQIQDLEKQKQQDLKQIEKLENQLNNLRTN